MTVCCNWNLLIFPPDTEFTVGLIWDTVPYSGYLKIFHNGKWGGVCPLSANWGWPQQDVVCKQLGYPKANRRGGTIRPGHKDIPWVLNSTVTCNGTESRLQDCQHGPLGDYECPYRYHRPDSVYVTCSPLLPNQGQSMVIKWWKVQHHLTVTVRGQL